MWQWLYIGLMHNNIPTWCWHTDSGSPVTVINGYGSMQACMQVLAHIYIYIYAETNHWEKCKSRTCIKSPLRTTKFVTHMATNSYTKFHSYTHPISSLLLYLCINIQVGKISGLRSWGSIGPRPRGPTLLTSVLWNLTYSPTFIHSVLVLHTC